MFPNIPVIMWTDSVKRKFDDILDACMFAYGESTEKAKSKMEKAIDNEEPIPVGVRYWYADYIFEKND